MMTATAATAAAATATTIYNGFRLTANELYNLDDLKKTVDDFNRELMQCPLDVTECRTALSLLSACGMLTSFTPDQQMILKRDNIVRGSLLPVLVPNRVGAKHFTKSSRVRNLVHGGMTGLLAVRLMNDLSQTQRRSRTLHSLHIIRRVNGESGCKHVHWSIPEFQMRFNIGIRLFKNNDQKNPYQDMALDELTARFNSLDTPENRQAFVDQCIHVANDPHQSRIVQQHVVQQHVCEDSGLNWISTRPNVLPNQWIMDYMGIFTKLCSNKMTQVGNATRGKIDRVNSLVDLYRFMSRIEWILTNSNMRNVTGMSRLCEKYTERLIYMSQEGIEHSACMIMRYFPEMMTPELHVVVNPVMDVYRIPQTEISTDDELFSPLKVQCQALLPQAILPPKRQNIYSDDDDDYYYSDDYYSDYDDDDDDR